MNATVLDDPNKIENCALIALCFALTLEVKGMKRSGKRKSAFAVIKERFPELRANNKFLLLTEYKNMLQKKGILE